MRFIPSRMVEAYVKNTDRSVRGTPNDWDIMYLKMLSIYCQNDSQNYITKENEIVLLDGLIYNKTSVPIIFEDFRPPTGTGKA